MRSRAKLTSICTAMASYCLVGAASVLAQKVPCAPTASIRETEVTVHVSTGDLHGTLSAPDGPGRVPLVVLLVGSGPVNRDGNAPSVRATPNTFKILADSLGHRGIASLRYDRRGIGGSAAAQPKESDFRFPMLADDAAEWVRQMRSDPRFGSIVLAGHSEGSLTAILASQRVQVDGLVSLAGPGRPHWMILRDQLAPVLGPSAPALLMQVDSILARLVRGDTTIVVAPELLSLFRPDVQPYLVSLYRYDPAAELAKSRIPILVLQGTSDLQVPNAEAEVLGRANARSRVTHLVGMNHVLKLASGSLKEQGPAYVDPNMPIPGTLIDAAAAFVCALPMKASGRPDR